MRWAIGRRNGKMTSSSDLHRLASWLAVGLDADGQTASVVVARVAGAGLAWTRAADGPAWSRPALDALPSAVAASGWVVISQPRREIRGPSGRRAAASR